MRGALAVVCLGAPGCDFSPPPMDPLPGVYETIGAGGGSLRSEDGVLTVEIPEGALSEEIEFRIVVTKDAPPSIGSAYHVEPSMNLSKPALVTYSYAGVDVSERDLEALRIGRDIGGEWEMLGTEKADEAASWVAAKDEGVSFNYGLVEEQHGVAVGDEDEDKDDGRDDAAEGGSDDGKGDPEGGTDGGEEPGDPGESDDGMGTTGDVPGGTSDGGEPETTGPDGSESTGDGGGNDGDED